MLFYSVFEITPKETLMIARLSVHLQLTYEQYEWNMTYGKHVEHFISLYIPFSQNIFIRNVKT